MHRDADPGEDKIYLDAADWIVRAGDVALSLEDARHLSEWREADGRHERAYRELEAVWHVIPELSHMQERYPLAGNDDEPVASPGWRLSWLRKAAGMAAGVAAVAAAVALVLPIPAEPSYERIATEVAQVSEVGLADGSTATLGPKTAIKLGFTPTERRLQFEGGEAFFDVAKSAERPFIVDTGNSFIRVVGTSFNVERHDGMLEIAVLHGTVQVFGKSRNGQSALLGTLTRGSSIQIISDTNGAAKLSRIERNANFTSFSTLAGGWRDGRLSYEDTKLSDIVADLNRYYAPGITIANPKLANLRVTASFKASGIREFINSIDLLFPVITEESHDGSFILRPSR